MKLIINENQRGLLFKNGVYQALLAPGKYFVNHRITENGKNRKEVYAAPFGKEIEVVYIEGAVLYSERCSAEQLLTHPEIAASTVCAEIQEGQLGFHFVNGVLRETLRAGKHVYWNLLEKHAFEIADTAVPQMSERFRALAGSINASLYRKYVVGERDTGLLFLDGKFEKLLPAGSYYFWDSPVEVMVRNVPCCLVQENIVGQEILTADKVSLRINCVCSYTVTDPVKAVTEVDSYTDQLHVAVQLALRAFVGKYRLDEILENKEGMSAFLFEKLAELAPALYLSVKSAAVRDIILPGEIRDIMNTVLVAEKRAQANLIARREEVASTRSLLNTAKLMEENATLYKLKELEYVERICEKVGNINLSAGGGDVLSQLTAALAGGGKNGC